MSLMDKMKKTGYVKNSSLLENSDMYNDNDVIKTEFPILNIAMGGSVNGGLTPGLTVLAGPSRHYKTGLALNLVKAFQDKYEDAVILFYDSEFGTPMKYFENVGCRTDNVLHIPIRNIEELKFDIAQKLQEIERKDNVLILIDSVGNLASKKEVDDALKENDAADMTRAKQVKSLFRIVTPYLQTANIPLVCVAHTYDTQEKFSKKVISGGTGIMYSANKAIIMGRRQDKDGTELAGYDFVINIEKSRYVREKSKVPVTIKFSEGIKKYSGIFDLAQEFGFIKGSGYYQLVDPETGELDEKKLRKKAIPDEYYEKLVNSDQFEEKVKEKYQL